MESNLSLQGQALVAWPVSVAGRIPQLSCVNVCTEFCRNAIHADRGVLQLALFLAYVMDTIPCNFIGTDLHYNLMVLQPIVYMYSVLLLNGHL